MSQHFLSTWHSRCELDFSAMVLPDGCRDLIVKYVDKDKPEWFVSPLFEHTEHISVAGKSTLYGFRLRPGLEISESELLSAIASKGVDIEAIPETIAEFSHMNYSVNEALSCLAVELQSVGAASARLGVSSRTLQRLLLNKTGKTPGYWLQLARVRKSARAVAELAELATVAELFGFSDQAHLSREFKRWLGATPTQLLRRPDLIAQLNDTGYA